MMSQRRRLAETRECRILELSSSKTLMRDRPQVEKVIGAHLAQSGCLDPCFTSTQHAVQSRKHAVLDRNFERDRYKSALWSERSRRFERVELASWFSGPTDSPAAAPLPRTVSALSVRSRSLPSTSVPRPCWAQMPARPALRPPKADSARHLPPPLHL